MRNICFYFQIHNPYRLKKYRFFEIGQDHYYYDDFQTEERLRRYVDLSYLNANRTILDMIRSSNGKFKCAFSISGIAIDQLEQFAPEVIDSFKELAKTGSAEFLAEPYAHSIASVYNAEEFERQVKKHEHKIEELFGKKPTAIANTELIYSDEIGEMVAKMGYKTILMDEAKHVLGWKSPNFLYQHSYVSKLKLLVRNQKFSDDLAFRFSNQSWSEQPMTAEKFAGWLASLPQDELIVNIGLGYEAFGILNNVNTGFFDFFKALPYYIMEQHMNFVLPSECTKLIESSGALSVPYPISWVGHEKDLSAWNGNDLQNEALSKLYAVAERVHLCSDKPLQRDWLLLQSIDHFRYMSHKDAYNSNYESAYEAFMNYMNVLADFLERVEAQYPTTIDNEELSELLKTINSQEKEIAQLQEQIKKSRKRADSVKEK